jgi:hypothetical protein
MVAEEDSESMKSPAKCSCIGSVLCQTSSLAMNFGGLSHFQLERLVEASRLGRFPILDRYYCLNLAWSNLVDIPVQTIELNNADTVRLCLTSS